LLLLNILTLTGLLIPALVRAGEGSFFERQNQTTWQPSFSAGMDSYLHTYNLATSDTTEALAEYAVIAALTGRSSRRAKHRWRLRAEGSAGTELFRENLEARYRFQGDNLVTRFRLDGYWRGRQYRDQSDYNLTSDNNEGRLDLRLYPAHGQTRFLELRGWGGFMNYQNPSSLEVDYNDQGAGAFVKSTGMDGPLWSIGSRYAFRAYPDSTVIDRRTLSLEGQLDVQDLDGQALHLFHKTDRRHIRDETVRPSAWSHWTDLGGKLTAGPGFVFLDLQGEIWQYDQDLSAYYDSWRVKTVAGYTWGDLLATTWQLGLTTEKLHAADNPEAYREFGLRGGAEAFGGPLSGSLILEVGTRMYDDGTVDLGDNAPEGSLPGEETYDLYSDFQYWEIWLTASWQMARNLSLDILASYEPENHTEQEDDATLGFASVRLVYRP